MQAERTWGDSPAHKTVAHVVQIKLGVLFCVYTGDTAFSFPGEGRVW